MNVKIPIIKYNIDPNTSVDVVRCDIIQWWFKRIIIDGIYCKSKQNNLVFATNSSGTGALALTLSLLKCKKNLIIFLSDSDVLSPNLSLCKDLWAKLDFSGKAKPFDSDSLRKEALEKYNNEIYEILPLGLENEEVKFSMINYLKTILDSYNPKEIWVVAASWLTIRSLQEAFPKAKVHAVVVKDNNPKVGSAKVHKPKEYFREPAKILPPYTSNLYYDAKIWWIITEYNKKYKIENWTIIFNIA